MLTRVIYLSEQSFFSPSDLPTVSGESHFVIPQKLRAVSICLQAQPQAVQHAAFSYFTLSVNLFQFPVSDRSADSDTGRRG